MNNDTNAIANRRGGMHSLLEVYTRDPEACETAFRDARGETIWEEGDCHPANDGPVTIQALAYAYYRQLWHTWVSMYDRAPDKVRKQAMAMLPGGDKYAYERAIGAGWIATTAHSASSHGQPVYIGDCPDHPPGTPHSLTEFCACGGLRAVRQARGILQEDAAAVVGVNQGTWSDWERGEYPPGHEKWPALRKWISGDAR